MRSKFAAMSGRLALWGVASLAIATGTAWAQARTVNLNIPKQDLGRALSEFARQSNQQLLYSPDLVRGRQAQALQGTYAADEALRHLLANTGISVRTTNGGAIVLAAGQPEPVRDPGTPPTSPAPPDSSGDAAQADQGVDKDEIVITGTLIRGGVAPAGANVISVGAEDIKESGAARGNDILASIPQISNFFNAMPDVGGNNPNGINAAPIQRPNLRNLFGNNTNSGALTLILMDGHRITPNGLAQIAVDPDVVPSALLERVEIMPDGASAVYGSDALGGVINFITRRSFNGVEASARYGVGKKDYNAWDANITAGKDWGSGSVFGAFSYSYHDPIFGKDRDFIQELDWNPTSKHFGLGLETRCDPGNITVTSPPAVPPPPPPRTYTLSDAGVPLALSTTANAVPQNRCDRTDFQTFYSKDRRWSFFAGFSQELSDSVRLDIRGFLTKRTSTTFGGPHRATAPATAIRPGNPNYRDVGFLNPADANAPQSVSFSYENVLPLQERNNILKTWQITPTLTWDVGSSWQIRALVTFGKNETGVVSDSINGGATGVQAARFISGLINPYNVDASGAGAFDNLVQLAQTRGEITFENYRVIADGPLVTLPGGELRVAGGAEYYSIDFSRRVADATSGFVLGAPVSYKQSVKALFGEVQIPIVGEGNRFPGVYAINVQGSLRHDKYNDFGGTTNPSLGVTYEPVSWAKLRGIWGKSFVAPSATAQLGKFVVPVIALGTPAFPLQPPPGVNPLNPNNGVGLFLNAGAADDLGPQTSKNWSIGAEIRPPFVSGLTLSATLYTIKVKGILGTPATGQLQTQFYPQFPSLWSIAPNQTTGFTQAEIDAFISVATQASRDALVEVAGRPVLFFADNRLRNLGSNKVKGIDFAAYYRRDIGIGTMDLSFVGNHELVSETQNGPGLPTNDLLLRDNAKWRWAAGAGLTSGPFRGKFTWNHTGGFDVLEANNNGQTRVKAFNTVDAFFSYDLGGMGLVEDVQLTLNINNIFDQDPPIYKVGGNFLIFGYSPTVFTVGRFVQLGIRTKF